MTHLSTYEKEAGRKNENITHFFKGDYVGFQLVGAVICATIAFMIVFGMYIYYDFEEFMENIYKMDLLEVAAGILKKYIVFTVGYCVVVYVAFSIKYSKAKRSLKRYFNNLKLLNGMLKKENEE